MKQIKIALTDAFGIKHEGAVFELNYAQKTVNRVETIGTTRTEDSSVTIAYQFKYWHSREAVLAEKQPMVLTSAEGSTMFAGNVQGVLDVEHVEQFCISHLVEEVLPKLDPEFKVLTDA
ncbi:hypothetical protein ACK36G_18815 [Aeromonas veronii]|uniref:hypothetical protein n=1 Tax=Aeromonas TaxID=642 RepID=UPI002E7B58B4|nr:hypothetical protein [Aeromonas caviae]MEE1913683.1 hypothetical protein [Aeromonas caviae]